MRKEQIKAQSSIRTLDEKYNEVYKHYQEAFNAQPDEVRRLGTYGDIVCTIREATLYLNQYGDLIPPKLAKVMKERIKSQKKLAVDWFEADKYNESNPNPQL